MSCCQDKQLRKTNRKKKRDVCGGSIIKKLHVKVKNHGRIKWKHTPITSLENLWHLIPGEMDEKSARQTQQECSALVFALFSALIKGELTIGNVSQHPIEQGWLIGRDLAANLTQPGTIPEPPQPLPDGREPVGWERAGIASCYWWIMR